MHSDHLLLSVLTPILSCLFLPDTPFTRSMTFFFFGFVFDPFNLTRVIDLTVLLRLINELSCWQIHSCTDQEQYQQFLWVPDCNGCVLPRRWNFVALFLSLDFHIHTYKMHLNHIYPQFPSLPPHDLPCLFTLQIMFFYFFVNNTLNQWMLLACPWMWNLQLEH